MPTAAGGTVPYWVDVLRGNPGQESYKTVHLLLDLPPFFLAFLPEFVTEKHRFIAVFRHLTSQWTVFFFSVGT